MYTYKNIVELCFKLAHVKKIVQAIKTIRFRKDKLNIKIISHIAVQLNQPRHTVREHSRAGVSWRGFVLFDLISR